MTQEQIKQLEEELARWKMSDDDMIISPKEWSDMIPLVDES